MDLTPGAEQCAAFLRPGVGADTIIGTLALSEGEALGCETLIRTNADLAVGVVCDPF